MHNIEIQKGQEWIGMVSGNIYKILYASAEFVVAESMCNELSFVTDAFIARAELLRHQDGHMLNSDLEYTEVDSDALVKEDWTLVTLSACNSMRLYSRPISLLARHGLAVGKFYFRDYKHSLVRILSEDRWLSISPTGLEIEYDLTAAHDIFDDRRTYKEVDRDSTFARPYFSTKEKDHAIGTDRDGDLVAMGKCIAWWIGRPECGGFVFYGFDRPRNSPIAWLRNSRLYNRELKESRRVQATHVRELPS